MTNLTNHAPLEAGPKVPEPQLDGRTVLFLFKRARHARVSPPVALSSPSPRQPCPHS